MWTMFYKVRTESKELKIMKSLNARKNLADKEVRYFSNLRKGYEGEKHFDQLLGEGLQCDCLILCDLLLQINNSTFQIDSLVITSNKIFAYEIKNHEDDFIYDGKNKRMFKKPDYEVPDPYIQLKKNDQLLRKWLQEKGFGDISLVYYVAFVNPRFTLYQASPDLPFIFPTQLQRDVIETLNSNSSKLTGRHKRLADQLINSHIIDPPYSQVPTYSYEELRKGITCAQCNLISVFIEGVDCICRNCGNKEKLRDAVVRSAEEYRLLFPNQRITTNVLQEWCEVIENKRRISRILMKNYKRIGTSRWTYFE